MTGIDLSGRWTGVYFYPTDPMANPLDALPPTPFSAELTDREGMVVGRTEEPDLFSGSPDSPSIRATLEGHHHGGVLTFTKFPEYADALHTIDYVGAISADGNSIEGDWIIHGDWSGRFRMQRSEVGVATAVEEAATA